MPSHEFSDLKSWRETLNALPAPVVARGPWSTIRQEVAQGYVVKLAQAAPDAPWEVWLNQAIIGDGDTLQDALQAASDVLEAACAWLQETWHP